jgi:hypothetical protein
MAVKCSAGLAIAADYTLTLAAAFSLACGATRLTKSSLRLALGHGAFDLAAPGP